MNVRDLLDALQTDEGDEFNDYTVIVVDEESSEFHGVKSVRWNHSDRNVTIETL